MSAGDEAARARLEAEARVMAPLSHPSIVTVYEYGEDQGHAFVAFEYVDGTTLRDRLQVGPPRPKDSLRISLAIAGALYEAHRRGVVHCDLKPENVLLGGGGRARLLDFGLALSRAVAHDDEAG